MEKITINRLVKLTGLSRAKITELLDRSGVEYKEESGRGGRFRVYSRDSLPQELRAHVLAAEFGGEPVFWPETLVDGARARRIMKEWQSAPEWSQKIARKRHDVLESVKSYASNKQLSQTEAEAMFGEGRKAYSASTLRRWRCGYAHEGLVGLLPSWGNNRDRTCISPEMRVFITDQLRLNPDLRPPRIHEMLQIKFKGQKVPTRKTVSNFIKKQWTGKNAPNQELFTFLKDPRDWKNKYLPAYGNMAADVPWAGHTWEIDSTVNDVESSEGTRLALVMVVDVYSRRRVVALGKTSKATLIAAAIRKALIEWGVPVRVRMDNGQDYQSDHVLAIFTALGTNLPRLQVHAPEQKPFVERTIGSCMRYLAEILPGYTGHNVKSRQAIRERAQWTKRLIRAGEPVRVPLEEQQLKEIFEKWATESEFRSHGGLGGKTPRQKWEESHRKPQKIRDLRILDVLLAPVAECTTQKKGIRLDGGYYVPSDGRIFPVGRRVSVRRDLMDAGKIYVFDHESGEFLGEATDQALSGDSLEAYMQAKNSHKKRLARQKKALNELSDTIEEPYTIVLGEGRIQTTTQEEDRKVISLQPEAETPAIREARKAFEPPDKTVGLADGIGQVISLDDYQQRAGAGLREETPPNEVLDKPVLLFDWFHKQEQKVGLSKDQRDHLEHLKRAFPEHYDEWNHLSQVRRDNAANAVPSPSQHEVIY